MLSDRVCKKDLLLTFALLRGEVTGRHPTEEQNKEGDAERVKRERKGEW